MSSVVVPNDSNPGGIRSTGGGPFVPPKIGATLGRYEIITPLGHGAMATVFRARDTQLGREVAVKVMSMALATRGGAAERFRREAQAVATLRHPSILEIHDFVPATEDEPSYIVTELINGPTLRALLDERRGRVLPEEAALIILPLAEALAMAHARGIVHRDVKPDNVMIEPRGDESRVVLTDFGVAQITGMETMTASGALVGSPAYMSPEQARGKDVGPPTDIWALGILLYELSTGVLPFSGKDPFTVISGIIKGAFRKPTQLRATIGADFEAIILRCLKPVPSDRFANAGLLANELRAFIRGAAIENEAASLRRFLDATEAFEADLRPKVADACVKKARHHVRRGELARAFAELGHATAYVPKHPGAEKLLRRLSAGRLVIKLATGAAVLALVVGGIYLAKPLLHPRPAAPSASPRTSTPQPIAPPVAPPPVVAAPSTPEHDPPPAEEKLADTKLRKNRGRSGLFVKGPSSTPPVERPAPEPAAPVVAATPPTPTPTEPPKAVPEEKPQLGSIKLLTNKGFCYPSLNDYPAKSMMPLYRDLPSGKHKVYCSRTLTSPREYVDTIDLPAGASIERTVRLEGDKLVIARPR